MAGEPLFRFMQARIFHPLEMNSTIDLDTIPVNSTALATGYIETALAPLEPAPYEGPGWSFGSGQVVTTATDVARWDVAFLKHRVLPARQAAEEITPAQLSNGTTYPSALGLFVSHEGGVTRYYHTGQGLVFEAVNMIYPDPSLGIVVLTNTSVKATYLKIADELTYLLLPPTANDIFARTIFSGLQSGQPDVSVFTEDLKQYLGPARLGEYRSSLGLLGPMQAFSLVRTQEMDGLTTREYDVIARGRHLRLHLLLLPDGRLEDVTVTPSP